MISMAEYEIERVCPVCGKHFDVLYKDLWAYKKPRTKGGYDFYCTWKCLRAAETNKMKKPEPVPEKRENKDRLAVLKDLMAAVKDGRDAYDYLQGMGYADPKDTLRRLRITAKKDAPEIYQQMEQNGLLDMRKEHSGKGVDKMSKHKLTREQKEKAVEIAIKGGDPLVYLKTCGAKNPTAAWWYIKKTLATKNPQLLEKIPEKIGTVLNEKGQLAEVAEKLPPEAAAEVPEADPLAGFVAYDPGAPEGDKTANQGFKVTELEKTDDGVRFVISVPPEQAEQMDKALKDIMDPENDRLGLSLYKDAQRITEPLKYDGFRVTAINGEFGQYRVGIDPSSKEAYFDFDGLDFDTQIRMPQHDLAEFVEELTRAAQILGVQV